jgi:hypothetical protein
MHGTRADGQAGRWRTVAVLLLALGSARQAPGQGLRPTPAPPGPVSLNAAGKAALLAYAHSLQFMTSVTASDEQLLIVYQRGRAMLGPFMSINPELGSGELNRAALASGRIIARVQLGRGTRAVMAYWYVDSSQSEGWRSSWIVDDPRWGILRGRVVIHQHADTILRTVHMLPRARIVTDSSGGDSTQVCGLCPEGWCRDETWFLAFAPILTTMSAPMQRSSSEARPGVGPLLAMSGKEH